MSRPNPLSDALQRLIEQKRARLRNDPKMVAFDLLERLQGRKGFEFGPVFPKTRRPD